MKQAIWSLLFFSFCLQGFSQYEGATKYAETITEDDLKDYLTILASDALEGRETGERGQKMAAAFIADHFQDLGLKPVIRNCETYSYYQPFELEKSYPGEIYVTIGSEKLINGEDLIYWGRKNMESEETISTVFLGDGSDEAFEKVDVSGKAVVIMAIGAGFHQWRSLSNQSEEEEAALTFLVVGEESENYFTMLSRFKRYFMGSRLGFKQDDSSEGGVFLISREIANKIFNTTSEKLKMAAGMAGSGEESNLKEINPAEITYLVTRESETMVTENVLGLIEGSDKKDEIIVITAHYDHIGKRGDAINNGADDDGSGTSAVMEIAEAFVKAKKEGYGPRRSILFMTVTGEEKGLLGSQYYVENPVFPLEKTIVNLNIDMIGRFDTAHYENREFVYLVGSDRLSIELHELSENTNETFTKLVLDYTYNDENHPERIYYRSDHWNFAKNGIPIIFYFTGLHEDYHKPTDTVDKIEFELLRKRTNLIYYTAWVLANREERPVVDKIQDTNVGQGN